MKYYVHRPSQVSSTKTLNAHTQTTVWPLSIGIILYIDTLRPSTEMVRALSACMVCILCRLAIDRARLLIFPPVCRIDTHTRTNTQARADTYENMHWNNNNKNEIKY